MRERVRRKGISIEKSFVSCGSNKSEYIFASLFFSFYFSISFVFVFLSDGECLLDGVKDEILDLESVLGCRLLCLGQEPELADQVTAVRQVLRRDEVNADRDAALKVFDLGKEISIR